MTLKLSLNMTDLSRWWHRERELWPLSDSDTLGLAVMVLTWVSFLLGFAAGRA